MDCRTLSSSDVDLPSNLHTEDEGAAAPAAAPAAGPSQPSADRRPQRGDRERTAATSTQV